MRARSSLLALLAAAIVGAGALGAAGCGGSDGDSSTPTGENAASQTRDNASMHHGDGDSAMPHDDAMKHEGNAMKHEGNAMKHEGDSMKGYDSMHEG